jgi:hypothetical protein
MVQGGTESIPYPQPMTMPNYSNMMMDGYHSATALYPSNAVRSPQPIAKSHHPQSTHQLMYAAAVSSPRPSSTSYTRRQQPAMGGPNYHVDMVTTGPSLPPLSQLLPSTKPSSDPMTAVYSPPPPHQAPSHQAAPAPQEAYEVAPSAYLPLNEPYSQPQTYASATDSPEPNARGHHSRPIISPRTSTPPHAIPTMNQDMMPMQPNESSQMTAAGMHPLQTVEGIYAYHPMMNAPNYDGSMMHMPMDEPPHHHHHPHHHLVHSQERHSYDSASSAYSKRQKVFSFVSLPGINQPKRPRRRYDEIDRLYHCNWQGCNKSYGTLNHLNAHVSMQKHVS